jgi:N-hydroxyarylamine O-acetyltransferase
MDESQRPLDLEAYFRRIGYAGRPAATAETLAALHARHAEAIPFENLAPFLGEPVRLDRDSLQEKLVARRRGGWCFEHNLLFAAMLEAIGFRLTRLAARVRWNVPAGTVTARSHMLLLVRLAEGDYIADVGFGGLTLSAPLRLMAGIEQRTPHEPHRLLNEATGYVLQARVIGEWQPLYAFELHEQALADYEVSNWYLANNPKSHFVTGVLAARAEPGRRHALRNTRYAMHPVGGETEKREIADVDEYKRLLAETFAIELPDTSRLDERLAKMIRESDASRH